jgi:hypothetical protein
MRKQKSKMKKAITSVFEMFTLVVSIFSFAFIIGGMFILNAEKIEATSGTQQIPTGCCLQANDGSICQEMNQLDAANCKTGLLATSCDLVSSCQPGCCYDSNLGSCSLNSPKDKCTSLGGNWSNSPTCAVPQCQIGCCILGNQASTTTPLECSRLSKQYGFTKDFQALDADGTCNSKTNLQKEGACTTPSNDYSGKNDCLFTTKQQCAGNFYEGVLCTSKALNTNCLPAKNTTCVSNKDQVYYVDSCGNLANVYDANKFNNQSYWEQIITPANSCFPEDANCGNCDYILGSRCYAYRSGMDTKPTLGDNVCRSLDCINGKKHGESWCIGDYNSENLATAPVGSRFFKGTCFEGDITIEPCADFSNEVCIEDSSTLNNASFTEAKCQTNEWRSCIAANQQATFAEIKTECEKYDQCTMFLDVPGKDIYEGLPGFKDGVENSMQGNAGSIGMDANKVIAHCVPKYTPGMVFWQPTLTTASSKTSTGQSTTPATSTSGYGSGGSLEETNALCSLGNFICVAHKTKGSSVDDWNWKENQLCADINSPDAKKWIEALNERCKSIGPCGGNINIAGEIGTNNLSMFSTININPDGKMGSPYSPDGYSVDKGYLESLPMKSGLIQAGSLSSLTSAIFLALMTGNVVGSNLTGSTLKANTQATAQHAKSKVKNNNKNLGVTTSIGALTTAGMGLNWLSATSGASGIIGAGGTISLSTIGTTLGAAAVAAVAGYFVGQLIGKAFGLRGPETQALSWSLAAGAGLYVGTAVAITGPQYTLLTLCVGPWAWLICLAILIIMILTYIFTYKADRYYITSFSCQAWKPPKIGDCSACNNDIRTCSENRCKSLGLNCQYFNNNGEPGYCATSGDTWSAKISPWPAALSGGNRYTDISDTHFSIEGNSSTKVPAWTSLQFGIITDKPAQCKIDNKHTNSFDEMSTSFIIDSAGCLGGACNLNQGTYHKVALSPYLGANQTSSSTLGMSEGDNEYYIRCRNFAGMENRAEFAVKVIVDSGPDLTPPIINSFNPVSNSYLSLGSNSTSIAFYVNEPSDCKYSQGIDMRYEDMTQNANCFNKPGLSVLGNWLCYASLNNLSVGNNDFYFQCQDQPSLDNRSASTRNINRNSKQYTMNVCGVGLDISDVQPDNTLITGKSPISVDVNVQTTGCIKGGEATCYYRFDSGFDVSFLNTNSTKHQQTFSNLPNGDNNITIKCLDAAGNSVNKSMQLKVFLDNQDPIITRFYNLNDKLTVITDETSSCKFINNASVGCSFDFNNGTAMDDVGKYHYATWSDNLDYFIKCQDGYNNTNLGCGVVIKSY